MASFRNVSEKAKLQRELQFYTNLVSNHEKLLQTGKTSDIKQSVLIKPYENPVQLGNCSRSHRSVITKSVCPPKSVASNVNLVQRSVIQNKFKSSLSTPSLFSKRSVIKPSLADIKRNLPSAMAYRKINNNQQRTVLHSTKSFITKNTVSIRSVLPPQNILKSTNGAISKSCTTKSSQSNDLKKTLSETKKVYMKMGSKKRIDELNALATQLEKRNKNISLLNKCKSLPRFSVKSCASNNVKSSDGKLTSNAFKAKNFHHNNISELDSLKCKVENIAKLLSITPKNTSEKIANKPASSFATLRTPKSMLNSSSLPTINAKAPVRCSLLKDKNLNNKLLLSSNQISKTGKETVTKLVKSPKCVQSDYVSTPVTKNLHKLSNIKKSLASSQGNVKSVEIKSNQRNKLFLSSRAGSEIAKEPLNKLLKISKPSQTSCSLTPVTKRVSLQKLSSIKKRGSMTKLIASKYKIVNKNPSDPLVVSGQSKFLKRRQTAYSSSFNKWPQSASKAPCVIKTLNSNYKVVNLVKSPKRFNNSLLKASTPRNLVKHKPSLKKRLDACVSTQKFLNAPRQSLHFQKSFVQKPVLKPKVIFKHTKVNYLVRASSENLPKSYLNRKSRTLTMNSKFKVVNRPGSSKKLSKSPKLKHDAVHRTKSGVDIDLLLELAAEKESIEKESGVKPLRKRAVLLKRVYKSKNAIVNKNVCSTTSAKVAKMIKAKYSMNKKNTWQKQSISKRCVGFKHCKGYPFSANFQKIPNKKQFYNIRVKRNYFTSPDQKHKNIAKFRRYDKSSLYFNKTYKKSFIRNDHLKTFPSEMKYTPISKVLASRVLHRSINRVLSASVKKKLSKVNTYCMFYNRFGRCNKGLKCTYVHDPSKIAVCTRFLRGTCKKENCLFSHEISPGKMAICSFFLLGSCTKTDCPYRHETLSADAELCKAFVQGYCPEGKQCKKAHVLVCPQYIQGFCEKGDACAFPHPPPKEKKLLPKPVEKSETPMEAEDLMERVSRYFQPANEHKVEISETAVVPKRQKLIEQPSFIAL